MAAYLTLEEFKDETLIPDENVDEMETLRPGWIDRQLERWSRWIDAKLIKRYGVPFTAPYPLVLTEWLTRIVTVRFYLKRGIDPNDQQWQLIKQDCDAAIAEITEAANSETGLFELPLRDDNAVSGVAKASTFGHAEHSPYVWTDEQADAGHMEDSVRRGSDV